MISHFTSSTSGLVTLRDIAKRLNVSHATVSLALRDHPRISAKRREEVQKIAKEMGYRPDPMLAALAEYRHQKSPVPVVSGMAWITRWNRAERTSLLARSEIRAYWKGAFAEAEAQGYRLEEVAWDETCSPARMEQILATRGIQAILLPPHEREHDWAGFDWNHFSAVCVGQGFALPLHKIDANYIHDGILAMESIRARGYKRVGFVGQWRTQQTGHDRPATGYTSQLAYLNYSGTMLAQGEMSPESVMPPFWISEGAAPAEVQERFVDWLRANRPDAILSAAPGIRDMLRLVGLEAPRDIGLAAMNVNDGTSDAGICPQMETIGQVAVRTLISLVRLRKKGFPPYGITSVIEGKWVDGESLPPKN
ncbi:LacI family transcriptional regulator [Verrucomicrobium sp. GAS474]|uniref:LacI family DNA-binding transcriptional regulator n=1 Tax=Verrucomicrobium sp. GAS474 TaxID=1882831 RepID=UPI00087D5612|nr:LacI family DNA-binding transcriptional regulator [Verrucomicrobium sp. GAS474]SDU21180.1 LacI family transcriptional regulator [Verrucomicrobium sp. GAS474]